MTPEEMWRAQFKCTPPPWKALSMGPGDPRYAIGPEEFHQVAITSQDNDKANGELMADAPVLLERLETTTMYLMGLIAAYDLEDADSFAKLDDYTNESLAIIKQHAQPDPVQPKETP